MASLIVPPFSRRVIQEGGGSYQSIYEASTVQKHAIGTQLRLHDTRKFRYDLNGGVAITRGLMQQAASLAVVPFLKYAQIAQAGYAHAAGDQEFRVLVTTGSLATGVENCLQGGRLIVATAANINDTYEIVASKHYDETRVDVRLKEPLRTAIAVTDKVGLAPSPWMLTVVMPVTTPTAAPAGVPLCSVPAGSYYWAQTGGECAMTADTGDALVIGSQVGIAGTNAVAGAVGIVTATGNAFPVYGRLLAVGAPDESCLVYLTLE